MKTHATGTLPWKSHPRTHSFRFVLTFRLKSWFYSTFSDEALVFRIELPQRRVCWRGLASPIIAFYKSASANRSVLEDHRLTSACSFSPPKGWNFPKFTFPAVLLAFFLVFCSGVQRCHWLCLGSFLFFFFSFEPPAVWESPLKRPFSSFSLTYIVQVTSLGTLFSCGAV